jgi:hypothetical protein
VFAKDQAKVCCIIGVAFSGPGRRAMSTGNFLHLGCLEASAASLAVVVGTSWKEVPFSLLFSLQLYIDNLTTSIVVTFGQPFTPGQGSHQTVPIDEKLGQEWDREAWRGLQGPQRPLQVSSRTLMATRLGITSFGSGRVWSAPRISDVSIN